MTTGLVKAPARCFIGMPSYDGTMRTETMKSIMSASKIRPCDWRCERGSLLAMVFNRLFAVAYNEGYEYFAMIHADVAPEPWWIDTLFQEMEDTGADVVSAVIPIKDGYGLTSTAIAQATEEDPWGRRRLTMTEIMDLPETFCYRDVPWNDGQPLLVNTGCWLMNMKRSWVKKFPGFSINDKLIRTADDKLLVHAESEDWAFSRWLHEQGCRVYATRKVPLLHFGGIQFSNAMAWGAWKRDEAFFPKENDKMSDSMVQDAGKEDPSTVVTEKPLYRDMATENFSRGDGLLSDMDFEFAMQELRNWQ